MGLKVFFFSFLFFFVAVHQTEDESGFCSGLISRTDTLIGSHLASDQTGNMNQAQHARMFFGTIMLNSFLINIDLFCLYFLFLAPQPLTSPICVSASL